MEGKITDVWNSMNISSKHLAHWNKPDLKDNILCNYVYMTFQKRQSFSDRKQTCGFLDPGVKSKLWESFWSYGNVLHLNCNGCYIMALIRQNSWNLTQKLVHITVYELYFNEDIKEENVIFIIKRLFHHMIDEIVHQNYCKPNAKKAIKNISSYDTLPLGVTFSQEIQKKLK